MGCEVRAHPSSAPHPHRPGPHPGWAALRGDAEDFRVPPPQPPILAPSCLCPCPRRPQAIIPAEPPGPGPPARRPPREGARPLERTKPPKTLPQPWRPRTPTHLSVRPSSGTLQQGGPLGTSWRSLSRCGAQASGCGTGCPQGGPGWSPLTPPSQPAGSPRGQDRTNYLPNCMVLKAPRHPRVPRAAACMTTAPPGLPRPPARAPHRPTKKGKKRIHKKVYILTKKNSISEFARTVYHNMCLALPRTSINF